MTEFANRAGFEQIIADGLEAELTRIREQLETMIQGILEAGNPDDLLTLEYDVLEENFEGWVASQLEDVYTESANLYSDTVAYPVDPILLQDSAIGWAEDRARLLVSGMNRTTSQKVDSLIDKFREGGMTNERLIERLGRIMSPERAEMVAITEVTRSASAGQEFVANQLRSNGANMRTVWQTLEDERVCPICSPRNGMAQGTNWFDLPPAHPYCRCFVTYEVIVL